MATCAIDGYDESDLPCDNEWNEEWNDDLDMLKDHLEASYADGEAQYYADSDMPSDVEFTVACENNDQHVRKEDHAFQHAFGFVEDLLRSAFDSWKPTGFPFHHFPAGKAAVDFSAPSKKGTP